MSERDDAEKTLLSLSSSVGDAAVRAPVYLAHEQLSLTHVMWTRQAPPNIAILPAPRPTTVDPSSANTGRGEDESLSAPRTDAVSRSASSVGGEATTLKSAPSNIAPFPPPVPARKLPLGFPQIHTFASLKAKATAGSLGGASATTTTPPRPRPKQPVIIRKVVGPNQKLVTVSSSALAPARAMPSLPSHSSQLAPPSAVAPGQTSKSLPPSSLSQLAVANANALALSSGPSVLPHKKLALPAVLPAAAAPLPPSRPVAKPLAPLVRRTSSSGSVTTLASSKKSTAILKAPQLSKSPPAATAPARPKMSIDTDLTSARLPSSPLSSPLSSPDALPQHFASTSALPSKQRTPLKGSQMPLAAALQPSWFHLLLAARAICASSRPGTFTPATRSDADEEADGSDDDVPLMVRWQRLSDEGGRYEVDDLDDLTSDIEQRGIVQRDAEWQKTERAKKDCGQLKDFDEWRRRLASEPKSREAASSAVAKAPSISSPKPTSSNPQRSQRRQRVEHLSCLRRKRNRNRFRRPRHLRRRRPARCPNLSGLSHTFNRCLRLHSLSTSTARPALLSRQLPLRAQSRRPQCPNQQSGSKICQHWQRPPSNGLSLDSLSRLQKRFHQSRSKMSNLSFSRRALCSGATHPSSSIWFHACRDLRLSTLSEQQTTFSTT